MSKLPTGVPAIKAVAMPADTNSAGDIFGGWLLAQMDLAGGVVAYERAQGRTATVAIEAMTFKAPVFVGDLVSFYADIVRTGRTSLTIEIEAWARRGRTGETIRVTEGRFVYVALDDARMPRTLPEL